MRLRSMDNVVAPVAINNISATDNVVVPDVPMSPVMNNSIYTDPTVASAPVDMPAIPEIQIDTTVPNIVSPVETPVVEGPVLPGVEMQQPASAMPGCGDQPTVNNMDYNVNFAEQTVNTQAPAVETPEPQKFVQQDGSTPAQDFTNVFDQSFDLNATHNPVGEQVSTNPTVDLPNNNQPQ